MSSRNSGTYRLDAIALEPDAASPTASESRGRGNDGGENASYEEAVDVEIYSDGMWQSAAKTMWPSSEKTRTWGVFPGAPRAADDAAPAPEPPVDDPRGAAGARAVASSTTVRVGVAVEAPHHETVRVGVAVETPHAPLAPAAQSLAPTSSSSPAEAKPNGKAPQATQIVAVTAERPVHKPAPTIRANNPTRIFEIPPTPAVLARQPLTKTNEALLTPTSSTAPAVARESGDASRATLGPPSFSLVRSPVRSSKDLRCSAAAPSREADGAAKSASAPLLRAFDDGKPRKAAWSEAQTLCQPLFPPPAVSPTQREERGAKAAIDPVARRQTGSGRPPSPRRLIENLRQLTKRKGMLAFALAAPTIVGASALATWSIAHLAVGERAVQARPSLTRVEARSSVPPAALSHLPSAPASPRAVEPESPPPPEEATSPDAVGVYPPSSTVAADELHHDEPAQDKPSPAPPSGVSHQVTPARRAVDALLAGDRENALRHYRELSRAEPERRVYREAVRLLSRPASSTPN